MTQEISDLACRQISATNTMQHDLVVADPQHRPRMAADDAGSPATDDAIMDSSVVDLRECVRIRPDRLPLPAALPTACMSMDLLPSIRELSERLTTDTCGSRTLGGV